MIRQTPRSSFIAKYRLAAENTLENLPLAAVIQLIELLDKSRRQDHQIFVCGNGGSAAMSSHLAGELGKEPVEEVEGHMQIQHLVSYYVAEVNPSLGGRDHLT